MRGYVRVMAVLMLSGVLGLHWAVLQTVAWTSMLIERIPTQSLTSALVTTFDGNHPCQLCLAIRDSKSATSQESVPTPAQAPSGSGLKLDAWVCLESVPNLFPAGVVLHGRRSVVFAPMRGDPPPLPPPRSA
jgi:hypothetical protein